MIFPFSCRLSNQGELQRIITPTIVVLALLAGFAGCEKEKVVSPAKANKEAPASPQIEDEELEDDASNSEPAPSQPTSKVLPADQSAPELSVATLNDRTSAPIEPATEAPTESAKSLSSGPARKRSPEEALSAAKNFQQSAAQYARQGKLEPAYKEAVEGWQMVRIHPSDPNCKQIAAKLIEDIKNYSDQLVKAAGGQAGMPDASKPIRFE